MFCQITPKQGLKTLVFSPHFLKRSARLSFVISTGVKCAGRLHTILQGSIRSPSGSSIMVSILILRNFHLFLYTQHRSLWGLMHSVFAHGPKVT